MFLYSGHPFWENKNDSIQKRDGVAHCPSKSDFCSGRRFVRLFSEVLTLSRLTAINDKNGERSTCGTSRRFIISSP